MTTYTVPTSVAYNGQTFLMPGHASYVAGTDVTDPLLYWLTRDPADETKQGIGADKFTLRSGTESDPTVIQFRDATYWCEYGNVIGAGITTDRQTDVAETAIVTVTFSESVTDVVLQVRTGDQTTEILSGTVAGSGTTWTFTPAPPFMADHRYTVIVNDAVDAAGNHMSGRFSSTFDTVVTDDPEPYGPVFNRSRRNRRWRL